MLDEESGLIYVRNRYLQPGLGIFISIDPISYSEGNNLHTSVWQRPPRQDVNKLNLYQVELDNPINLTDSTGEMPCTAAQANYCSSLCKASYPGQTPTSGCTATRINIPFICAFTIASCSCDCMWRLATQRHLNYGRFGGHPYTECLYTDRTGHSEFTLFPGHIICPPVQVLPCQ